jgi:ribosomal protein S18 acetylase RimI-like enzyme
MLTTSARDIAGQIAGLLNAGGQLVHFLTIDSILANPIEYIIEMDGEKVAGFMGLERFGSVTEMKHLCVHPEYRRRGLGRKLLEKGIEASQTEYVYGAVRSDNHTNVRNNLRIGMKPIGKRKGRGCQIIIFARRKNVYNRRKTLRGGKTGGY